MELRRLRAGLRRLRSNAAFSLIETMIAFALIGITALVTASGLIAALGIYNSANELRNACGEASRLLYEAVRSGEDVDIYDPDAPEKGVVTRTGDFSPELSDDNVIDVYAVCVTRSDYMVKNRGIVFYYYESADNG